MALTLNDVSGIVRDASEAALKSLPERERARASAAVFSAFSSAVRTAKDQRGLLNVAPDSIAACVTAACLLGVYPTGTASTGAYLVPTDGAMQYRLNHRGYAALGARMGYGLHAVPVGVEDEIEVDFDEVVRHRRADLTRNPTKLEEMLGVYVTIRHPDGHITRPWVPLSVVQRSRASSKMPKGTWDKDACQMAMGAAMRSLVLRGVIPVSGEMNAALAAADLAGEDIEEAEEIAPAPRRVTMAAPPIAALPAQAPMRQLAAPAFEEPEWSPPPADPIPVTTQSAAQTTRAAPTWSTALRTEIAALAVAMGRPAPTTIGTARALLSEAGISAPDAMEPTALATALAEAAVNAAEREPTTSK